MPSLMETLGIDKLTLEEQVQLADEIMEKTHGERELPPLSKEHLQELDRRIQAIDSGAVKSSPLEEVRALFQPTSRSKCERRNAERRG